MQFGFRIGLSPGETNQLNRTGQKRKRCIYVHEPIVLNLRMTSPMDVHADLHHQLDHANCKLS